MSQVKNLRAMFEQRGDSSPPERGRVSGLPAQNPESPRPLSRVRTSFIAVEKDGRIGLHRDPSADSAISQRKTSGASEAGSSSLSASLASTTTTTTKDKLETPSRLGAAAFQTPVRTPVPIIQEPDNAAPAPAAATTTPLEKSTAPVPTLFATPASTPNPPSAPTNDGPAKKTPDEPAKNTAEGTKASEKRNATLSASEKPASQSTSRANTPGSNGTTNGAASAAGKPTPAAAPKAVAPAKAASKATNHKETHKSAETTTTVPAKHAPKTISTAKANAKPASKSPPVLKTPTGPPKSRPAPAKTPEKKAPLASEKTATVTPKSTTSSVGGKSTASSAKKLPIIQAFPPNGVGFVKPKPKSPTRPVQLPSGLTTHTAASATKVNASRQSLSRQSNYAYHPTVRASSRASVSTVGAAPNTGAKTLKRQSSTISRSRPSIGPPPKPAARDHPLTSKEKEVDAGFLARMMRPTQASALKIADKTHIPPPSQQHITAPVKRHAARNAASAPVKRTLPVKKIVPKAAPAHAATKEVNGKAAAPVKAVRPAKAEEPVVAKPEVASAPVVPTDPIPAAIPVPVAAAPVEVPAPAEAPVEIPTPVESPSPAESPAPVEVPAPARSPVAVESLPPVTLPAEELLISELEPEQEESVVAEPVVQEEVKHDIDVPEALPEPIIDAEAAVETVNVITADEKEVQQIEASETEIEETDDKEALPETGVNGIAIDVGSAGF